jgi:hypothetical protein
LGRHALHLLVTEGALQLLRRNGLIGAVSHPGLSDVTQARLLEGSQQPTKAATHAYTTLLATAKHVHQDTL